MHVRRLSADERSAASAPAVNDAVTAKKFPAVYEFMTATRYEDGSARKPSSLLIFASDGQFKAMLKDADHERCLWVAAPTLAEVFVALEACLVDPHAVWRVDRQQTGQTAARIKKGT